MTVLDWREKDGVQHWNDGRRESCRWCGHLAFLIDDDGVPSHKGCAEAVLDRRSAINDNNYRAFDLGRSA